MVGTVAVFLLNVRFSSLCVTDFCGIIDYFLLGVAGASLPVASMVGLGKRFSKRKPVSGSAK